MNKYPDTPPRGIQNLFGSITHMKEGEKLLIITDDGDYAHRMLTPKNGVCKYYHARLRQPITPEDVRIFAEGVTFADGGYLTRDEGFILYTPDGSKFQITVRQV